MGHQAELLSERLPTQVTGELFLFCVNSYFVNARLLHSLEFPFAQMAEDHLLVLVDFDLVLQLEEGVWLLDTYWALLLSSLGVLADHEAGASSRVDSFFVLLLLRAVQEALTTGGVQ